MALAMTGCADAGDDGEDAALGRDAIEALDGTAVLLTAVATDGVQEDAAALAAARVASDSTTVFDAVDDLSNLRTFLTQVLESDPATLASLIALGVDGLAQSIRETVIVLADPLRDDRSDGDKRLALSASALGFVDYMGVLSAACDEVGIDDDTRWSAIVTVLDLAARTPLRDGSFIVTLDTADLTTLAIDEQPVPEQAAGLLAGIGAELATVLVAALYDDPGARERLVGDVSLDAFAVDAFVVSVIDPQTGDLGRWAFDGLLSLLDA